LGFDFAVGPYAEHSRVVHRLSSGLGTWSIRSGTSQTLSGMDLAVCSQPLTFDGIALTMKRAGRMRIPRGFGTSRPLREVGNRGCQHVSAAGQRVEIAVHERRRGSSECCSLI